MRTFKRIPIAIVFALCFSSVRSVHAHPPPELWSIASTEPRDAVLVTTRGLIFGDSTTHAFHLLCPEAFREGASILPLGFARVAGGRWLLAANDGLQTSDDHGCSWQSSQALVGVSTPVMVQDPADAQTLYVATYALGRGGVQRSRDGGDTFTPLLHVSDDETTTSLVVMPRALYAGGVDGAGQSFVARSYDDGATWQRSPVALLPEETSFALLAVHPTDRQILVGRAIRAQPIEGERILFSRDGGETYSVIATLRAPRAATFSDDGAWLYVGGRDGVQRARVDAATSFAQVTTATRVSALVASQGTLFVGGYYLGDQVGVNGIGVASSLGVLDATTRLAKWMDFYETTSVIGCPASSPTATLCAQPLLDYGVENPPPLPVLDAGLVSQDASVSPPDAADASLGARTQRHDGCSVASRSGAAQWPLGAFVMLLLVTRRARLQRRLRRG